MTDEERLNNVYNQREQAIAESNNAYNELMGEASNLYNKTNNYAYQYEQIQNGIADKNLENQTQKIETQKEEARKEKEKESAKALNDYQNYTNPYGYASENLAQAGLTNSGVSETMRLGAYNAYQNRLAQANTTLQNAITTYDQAINDAIANNDVTKAQNALTKLQLELESAQTYYINKSGLTQSRLENTQNLNNTYNNLYNTVYSQILDERAQNEAIREYEQNFAYQKERDAISDAQWQKEYQLSKSNSTNTTNTTNTTGNSNVTTEAGNTQGVGTTLTSVMSPNLSSGDISKWFSMAVNNYNNGKSIKSDELISVISYGIENGKLGSNWKTTYNNVSKIYEAYGLEEPSDLKSTIKEYYK